MRFAYTIYTINRYLISFWIDLFLEKRLLGPLEARTDGRTRLSTFIHIYMTYSLLSVLLCLSLCCCVVVCIHI